MRTVVTLQIISIALALAGVGCGSQDPKRDASSSSASGNESGPLLPWKVGNTWTYRVTQDGVETTKITTVGEEELVGGTGPNQQQRANRVVTRKGADSADQTVSFQALDGEKVVRYRELAFGAKDGELELEEHWAPYKLHVDGTAEHVRTGASWLAIYDETKLPVGSEPVTATARDHWTVVSEAEIITVPAGTFTAVVLMKAGGSTAKQYWYVRGVGKVKETGGQVEELVTFEVAP